MSTSIRVLLVDDHVIVRQGLRQVLGDAEGIEVVDEAADGAEALRAIRTRMDEGLDVVLLDIALPGRDGLDVLKQIKAEYPRLGVVMLSTYPDRQFAVRCLRAGAQAYLNKSADPDDMLLAVRKCAGGGRYLTPATAEALAAAVGSGTEHRNLKRPRQGLGRPWDPGAGPDAAVAAAWSVRVGCRCPRLGRVRQARDASPGRVAASTSGLSLRRATSRCRGAHCCPGCAWCVSVRPSHLEAGT